MNRATDNDPKDINVAQRTPVHPSRSAGRFAVARAIWYVSPGQLEVRAERLSTLQPGDIRIETRYSGISRGTERLVATGAVPKSEWTRMRAPFQQGTFPFPVKYGYSTVGIVTAGEPSLAGKQVFCLHPHQTMFHVPAHAVVDCGEVPLTRATLAANMETALNAHWDAGTGPGDRIAVIGAGIVGLLTAYLARKFSSDDVVICDTNDSRRGLADALGIAFVTPNELRDAHSKTGDRSIVFHTSASSDGLDTAIAAAGFEATIVELSWYGDRPVTVALGGRFHSHRLKLISSQVGHVAVKHRARFNHRQRLERAMQLLTDDALDVLIGEQISFDEIVSVGDALWSYERFALPPIIRYG